MTTPTPAQMQANFNADLKKLEEAAEAYEKAVAEEKAAEKEYKEVILAKLRSLKSAAAIMVYLEMYVFQNSAPPGTPGADASIFGQFNDKLNIRGKELDVNSYLTAVHNDLQKMVDSDSPDPIVVKNVADDLDSILTDLTGNNPSLGDALKDALGASASEITTTDRNLRNQFYIKGDDKFNPPVVPTPKDPSGYSYHFVWGEPSDVFLTNFAEMEKSMKLPGDQYDATGAYKALTDNFNAMGSMTQSINAAVNEQITQITKFMQVVLGFYENGLLKPQMTMINASIANQRPG
jgi:hypothetical protein